MAKWHSLARKIAVTNIGLAVFAVVMVVALEYRKDRQLLETSLRRELTQSVATGAFLLDGARAEALSGAASSPAETDVDREFRFLKSTNREVARVYVMTRSPRGAPRLLKGMDVPAEMMITPQAWASLQASLDRGVPVSTGVYEDSEGQWLSAFYPVRDRRGHVVAVLGADSRAADLRLQDREKLRSTLLSASAAAMVAVVLSLLLARGVTQPLKLVAQSTSEIASGKLNVCLHMPRRDEIGELADSFNQMVERLAAAAEESERLHQQVLEKQKLEQELNLAAAIQQSFLPVSFPWSPRYRTNARTTPAEMVGGDFFDFLELSNERLGIVIGDVAGRGIAAAVYMARLISDFRAAAFRTDGPREALERLNQQLLARSTRGMFVTMAYLVLDASSGEVRYSSGGHLPALRRRGQTGAVEVLTEGRGIPLGIDPRPGLSECRLALEPRDTLLMVTDGVIESLNGRQVGAAFDTLMEVFRRKGSDDEHLVDAVFGEIGRLSPGAHPEDDMTVLSLSWTGDRSAVKNL